jgi:hypothetical protein
MARARLGHDNPISNTNLDMDNQAEKLVNCELT